MTSQAAKRQSINPGATRAMYDALHFSQATRVGSVTQLALPELCLEIRAVAVVGSGAPDQATEASHG